MVADLPWLNSILGNILSDPRDISPYPYRLFYVSLSFASTYLLSFGVIFVIAVILLISKYLIDDEKRAIKNAASFVYCFFIGGLSFASVLSVQGSIMNFSL